MVNLRAVLNAGRARASRPLVRAVAVWVGLAGPLAADDLGVTLRAEASGWSHPTSSIHLQLSRPLAPDEGRLAVFVGNADWSALAAVSETAVEVRPFPLRLPQGRSEVALYLVSAGNTWREVARLPLQVLTERGFEQADTKPTLEIGLQSQPAQGRVPAQTEDPRDTFYDGTLRLGLATTHVRDGWTTTTAANALGVTYGSQAVRFAEQGEDAPRLDLSDYQVTVRNGHVGFSAGHGVFGTHRHLIQSFRSRGFGGTAKLGAADLAVAAVNGSSVAGLSNFTGLGEDEHRLLTATLGLELLPARPGALRVASSLLDGSVLPLSNVNQGAIRDAETSRGLGLQVAASDAAARFRLDAGYARSRFVNPAELAASAALVPVAVRETTRAARYLDLGFGLVRNATVLTLPVNLDVGYRHSRVDPLYRTVATAVAADLAEDAVEATLALGAATSQGVHSRSRDNLAGLASILTTRSSVWNWTTAVPLGALTGGGAAWPTLSYTLNRTLQRGDGIPVDALFDSASQVPDQLSTNHTAGLAWQGAVFRGGYTWNRSFQDNRQPGRETADLENIVHSVQFGASPSSAFDVTADLAFEDARNHEVTGTDFTRRFGLFANWRPASRTALSGTVTFTFLRDDPETSERRVTDFNVQVSQSVALSRSRKGGPQGQVFARFARQTLWTFLLPDLSRAEERFWTLSAGLTLRPF